MDHGLEGKRALVTGAGSGIGLAIAEALAREGATVALHGRNLERTAQVRRTIEAANGRAISVAADLLHPAEIKAMCADTLARLGGIDIIVNNAGTGGCILFNASTSGKSADAKWTAYNASKHAVLQFMKCLAMEVGERDIRVNAICPGWAESKMASAAIHKTAENKGEDFNTAYKRTMCDNMLGALIGPESLADMAVYLAGRHGRYITGQAINVCGGVNYY